ncbi:MAG: hypothetical protein OXG49_09290 [Chloroflexi bacterium]|nr:hypothetical protein [Chloroflexota bacterium]
MPVKNMDKDERAQLKFDGRVPQGEDLSPAQQELLRDMRASLKQIKRRELLPAREALREIDQELEAEDNAHISDA